ncbi:hypothetical protein EXIGLDRAFT_784226 [Exidia glandulosa HHB12029]|uniref:Uncharacterized protein n=1 Tax=Exidia glandulosa HHB12029 TaxID=1314781 RepID=A0A166ML94_EXIGL|nr:hypothetical protein EXIGLDRAFT_784226 [Exidia glandulosa HHB12029]
MQATPNPQTGASTAVVNPQTGASTAVVAVNPNLNVLFERRRRPNTFNLVIRAIYAANREIPYKRAIEIYRELVRAG